MTIKVAYTIRYKNSNRYCSCEHVEITEDDLLEYIKLAHPPSRDDLYIENEIDIEGIFIV